MDSGRSCGATKRENIPKLLAHLPMVNSRSEVVGNNRDSGVSGGGSWGESACVHGSRFRTKRMHACGLLAFRMLTVGRVKVVEVLAAAMTCGTARRRRSSLGERRRLKWDDELLQASMHEGCEVKEMVYARGIEQWLTEAAVIDDDGGGDSRSVPVVNREVVRHCVERWKREKDRGDLDSNGDGDGRHLHGPGHNETGVESNSSPLRRKELDGAKALIAFSAGKAAKGGPVKKISKKKGLVDVARVFSDDESSDETLTSPAGRSLDLSTAPVLLLGADGAGGSAAAGASASAERVLTAGARVFGSPLRQPVVSPLVKAKGKGAAVETSASEYSLVAPHFAHGDFETRADLIPFVEGVSNLVLHASTPSLFTELNEFDEGCSAIKSLTVRILAAHCSTERTVRARLDGFKNRLRAKDDEIGRKNLEMEALANTLKEAKAENKRLQSKLEKEREARAEVDRLKADLEKAREAIAEVDRLQAELRKEKAHSAVLMDYYNLTEPKMEALHLEVSKAEASAAEESQRFSREMAKTTESARTACQTLRLTLTDMGAKVRGVPAEDASAFDFSEWTQKAGGSVSDCPTAYGDCCARVSAAFTMGLLQQFGCEHVAEFPNYAKGDWEISAQDISPALRAWRKQFWQKDGRSTAKERLLEQLAKAEAADLCEEEDATAEGGRGDAQDYPQGVRRKLCIRPPSGSWRNQNKKFVALKDLPKV
uniref:Uncharacterized protein n=2 Tax=Oryza sativa subsp. japonica TaxID=39947 RepID=Q10EN2_ORYSJ|nr:hypothetical protein [Oryza sativa Japonica Group]ABF98363.1 hypothetical protein LOC_Os03g49090 [Oryza sativa Japonica Group]